MSSSEKFDLTGDSEFEDNSQEGELKSIESDNSFRKFEVSSNPLSSMMGNSAPNLFGSAPTPGGLTSSNPAPVIPNTKKISLEKYGEIMLAMLASWHRQGVYVGGTLFEYAYEDSANDYILGSVITLSKNDKLLIQVNKLSEALGLPKIKKKADIKSTLKSFFEFNKNYITYFDKVRSRLSPSSDFYLGTITKDDYENEQKRENERDDKVSVDLKARKEKAKKETERREKNRLARLELIKQLKSSNKSSLAEGEEEMSREEKNLEVANIELSLSEEELNTLNESLELKRIELEGQIHEDRKRKDDLQQAILQEQDIRNQKRIEIAEQRKKKQEAEKAERLRRQQRLIEERKKREEVKQMRAKSLREAFDRAREAAIDGGKATSQSKGPEKAVAAGGKKDKKAEKKKYNPEAVKMMIRFNTDDKKIIKSTGITAEDLEELKTQITEEDKNL
ncbi:MAG: hypothetical protein HQL32_16260 [Planctomycetes bacterium]|nr:hypothetical protein [Planctomycetota bacterium]